MNADKMIRSATATVVITVAAFAAVVSCTVGYGDEYLPGPAGKLTDAQVRDIRWRYDPMGGVTQKALAGEFGVSVSTINAIVTGKAWGWLK